MESIKELRKICQDKGYIEHASERFWRMFSIYVTKFCLILGMNANLASYLSFIAGIISGYLFLKSYFMAGSIFLIIFYILDYVDGEIARYKKTSSLYGAWLDTVIGHILYPYFFFTLGLGLSLNTGKIDYVILGSSAAIAKLLIRSIPEPTSKNGQIKQIKQDINSIKMWVHYIGVYTIMSLLLLASALLKTLELFLWFYAIFFIFLFLGKIFLVGKRIYKKDKSYKQI